jgi:uncharacterized protein YceK
MDCLQLKSVVFPENLQTIGDNVFDESGLTSADVPNSVTSIGAFAFAHCQDLTSIHLPENLKVLSFAVLSGCPSLTALTIPKTLEIIGDNALGGCTSIMSLDIPETVYFIGNGAFGSTGISTLVLPSGITDIGEYTFGNCPNLVSMVIPDGVEHIGEGAFARCFSLESVTLPNSIKYMDKSVFQECSSLKEIIFPDLLDEISPWMCIQCTNLKKVVIPEHVEFIKSYAFCDCTSLTDFYCLAKASPLIAVSFGDTPIEQATLHVQKESYYSYKSTDPWSRFGNIKVIEEGELGIGTLHNDDLPPIYYDLNGHPSVSPHKGINILQKANGKTIKTLNN